MPLPGGEPPKPEEIVAQGGGVPELDEAEEEQVEEAIERGMSPEEAAELVGVSPNVIRAAIARGQLPGAKFGRSYRVLSSDLREYVRGGSR